MDRREETLVGGLQGTGRPGELLYVRVKRDIAGLLQLGVWRPSQALPSERKLAERFGVSMGTIRRVLDDLAAESILIRQQGRGTFVAAHDRNRFLFRFFHLSGHDGRRRYPQVELLHFETVRADLAATRDLGIASGARVHRIHNLLTLDGEAAVVDDIMLPAGRFVGMDEACVATRRGTLYQLYEERFGVSVTRIDERIRAVAADRGQAEALKVALGTPLLLVLRLAHTVDGVVVERRRSYVLTRSVEYAKGVGERESV